MARDIFENLGCQVLDAYNAAQALDIVAKHSEIRLVFADVRMPGEMNGVALARVLRASHPSLRVVLTSGSQPDGLSGVEYLPKPWNARQLQALLQDNPPTGAQ